MLHTMIQILIANEKNEKIFYCYIRIVHRILESNFMKEKKKNYVN